jgi:hypothetical protein
MNQGSGYTERNLLRQMQSSGKFEHLFPGLEFPISGYLFKTAL